MDQYSRYAISITMKMSLIYITLYIYLIHALLSLSIRLYFLVKRITHL